MFVNNLKDIDETVNNYFVNVGAQAEQNISKNLIIKPDKFLKNRNQFNFQIATFWVLLTTLKIELLVLRESLLIWINPHTLM